MQIGIGWHNLSFTNYMAELLLYGDGNVLLTFTSILFTVSFNTKI